MPEYLVTLRNNTTGSLFNVHVCNVNDVDEAINMACSDDYLFESQLNNFEFNSVDHISDLSLDCPF